MDAAMNGAGSNTGVGYVALHNNTADANTGVGNDALTQNTSGEKNTGLGNEALENNTVAHFNTAVGHHSLTTNTTGTQNTACGETALELQTTGSYNSGFGKGAGQNVTTGSFNQLIGRAAGNDITTGSNNVCLGDSAGRSNSPGGAITTQSNQVVLGNDSTTNLLCADTSISSSDSRDKTDITDFKIGLDWINALRPVTYRWDKRTWYGSGVEGAEDEFYGTPDGSRKANKLNIGFLAQEVNDVEKANGYGNDNDNMLICHITDDKMRLGLKYERLVPILVNAIKELSAKVTALEAG